jgi:hypothetical protein
MSDLAAGSSAVISRVSPIFNSSNFNLALKTGSGQNKPRQSKDLSAFIEYPSRKGEKS